jgi:hypothetical protein
MRCGTFSGVRVSGEFKLVGTMDVQSVGGLVEWVTGGDDLR